MMPAKFVRETGIKLAGVRSWWILNDCEPTNVFSVTNSSSEWAMLVGDWGSWLFSASILLSLSVYISFESAIRFDMGSLEISLWIDFSIELGCRIFDKIDDWLDSSESKMPKPISVSMFAATGDAFDECRAADCTDFNWFSLLHPINSLLFSLSGSMFSFDSSIFNRLLLLQKRKQEKKIDRISLPQKCNFIENDAEKCFAFRSMLCKCALLFLCVCERAVCVQCSQVLAPNAIGANNKCTFASQNLPYLRAIIIRVNYSVALRLQTFLHNSLSWYQSRTRKHGKSFR